VLLIDPDHIPDVTARTRILKLLSLVNLCHYLQRYAFEGTLAPTITLGDLFEAAMILNWQYQPDMLRINHAAALAVTA
jgi:hypothetical protein